MDTRLNGTVTALRIAIGLMATLAGLDKFFHFLVDWDQYLAPVATDVLAFSAHTIMMVVGVIEIAAGVLVALRPRIGGYVVAVWLWAIIVNLLVLGDYFDVALRDPANPSRLLPIADTGDHLHPNEHGYQLMAAAIDLQLFK